MTAPWDFEIEAEPVEASHLVKTRCRRCGGMALAAPERAAEARCAVCWGSVVGTAVPAGRMAYTVPVGYPLGQAPEVAVVREPYLAPEVTSREGLEPPDGWPVGVARLVVAGLASGWRVERTWARGCLPHATTGCPGDVKDSYAVRLARPGWGAWAVMRGDSWKFVWIWGDSLLPFGLCNMTELRAWLDQPARDESWYALVRERAFLADERRKASAAARPKKAREGMS